MKERIVNKLVRDYIPDIIREKGQTPVIRTLDDEEFIQCLEKKLREEVDMLEHKSAEPGFWDNMEQAQKVVAILKAEFEE